MDLGKCRCSVDDKYQSYPFCKKYGMPCYVCCPSCKEPEYE